MVPLASIFNGIGDFAGSVILLLPFNPFGLIGHGGSAMLTVFFTIGTVKVQFPPQAGQSNFSGIIDAFKSTESLLPVVIGRSRETL
jgi:hypothetical protein